MSHKLSRLGYLEKMLALDHCLSKSFLWICSRIYFLHHNQEWMKEYYNTIVLMIYIPQKCMNPATFVKVNKTHRTTSKHPNQFHKRIRVVIDMHNIAKPRLRYNSWEIIWNKWEKSCFKTPLWKTKKVFKNALDAKKVSL